MDDKCRKKFFVKTSEGWKIGNCPLYTIGCIQTNQRWACRAWGATVDRSIHLSRYWQRGGRGKIFLAQVHVGLSQITLGTVNGDSLKGIFLLYKRKKRNRVLQVLPNNFTTRARNQTTVPNSEFRSAPMAASKRTGRQQLPYCYYEGYLEKRSFKDQVKDVGLVVDLVFLDSDSVFLLLLKSCLADSCLFLFFCSLLHNV